MSLLDLGSASRRAVPLQAPSIDGSTLPTAPALPSGCALRVSLTTRSATHLTALNLQLELARNIAGWQTKGPVDHAHALTKKLLVEVQSVVSAML